MLWLTPQPGAVAGGAPVVGSRAPGFVLKNFDGGTLVSKDLVGKVVILNFWASWCPPCRAEMPLLERVWTAYKERDVVIVGINSTQDAWNDARAFLRTHRITYPNVRDESGHVAATYGVIAMPTTYFIGRDGRIQEQFVGGFAGDLGEEELYKRIEALLR
jgi:peroxiredoxin